MTRETRIYRWYISQRNDYFVLRGVVTGHLRLVDSCNIRTSPIQSVKVSEDKLNVIINTVNTTYICGIKDCSHEKALAYAEKFSIRPEWYNEFEQALTLCQNKADDDGIDLADNSLLLILGNNAPYYFHSMYMTIDNKLATLNEPDIHVGTFQDSVLCFLDLDGKYIDMRYFPHRDATVQFYSGETCELDLYIENKGDIELKVGYFGMNYTINVNERKHIVPENADKIEKVLNSTDLYSVWLDDAGNRIVENEEVEGDNNDEADR